MEVNLERGNYPSIDTMFPEGDAVLHIENKATQFSAATLLAKNGATYGQAVRKTWLAFVMNCV